MKFENTIICGDCLEVMKDWPDGCVDLVVTSPPYNTGDKSLGYHPKSKTGDRFYISYEDNLSPDQYDVFISQRIHKTIRLSRYAFWNFQVLAGNKETVFGILYGFRHKFKDMFIWNKQAVSQIVPGIMAKGYEIILMFGQDTTMQFKYNNFPSNNYVPNRETWFKKESIPEHHATFPLELPLYFIQHFSKPNDLILDPFCGSGTTCVAAKMLGRRYIGIDISEEYCQIARDRLRAVDTGVPVKDARAGQGALFE